MAEPEGCPTCNAHPHFDEISEGEFECLNCGTIIDKDGKILKEGKEPNPYGIDESDDWEDEDE